MTFSDSIHQDILIDLYVTLIAWLYLTSYEQSLIKTLT